MPIIDRRTSKNGSSGNRQKFLKRVRGQINKAMPEVINDGSIKDMTSKDGHVKVPIKGVKEPEFKYNKSTGKHDYVLPGNKQYSKGDVVPKPYGGGRGKGRKGGQGEDGTDDFVIILSKEEFLQYFFEDLELPNLVKEALSSEKKVKYKRVGISTEGAPNRLNIARTFKKSLSRRIGVEASLKRKINELERLLLLETDEEKRAELIQSIEEYKKKLRSIVFLDDVDLTYNYFEKRPQPNSKAVMFNIMDVSGSMTYEHKDIAKRFFMLLYMFLEKNYDHVELVFIRHTTHAEEVDEKEFFESQISGGTTVNTALTLVNDIISKRYDSSWNLYCCQASDGDVWDKDDAAKCCSIVQDNLLPKLQYMAYIDIAPFDNYTSELYTEYESIKSQKFSSSQISGVSEIWTVFKGLFQKQNVKV